MGMGQKHPPSWDGPAERREGPAWDYTHHRDSTAGIGVLIEVALGFVVCFVSFLKPWGWGLVLGFPMGFVWL